MSHTADARLSAENVTQVHVLFVRVDVLCYFAPAKMVPGLECATQIQAQGGAWPIRLKGDLTGIPFWDADQARSKQKVKVELHRRVEAGLGWIWLGAGPDQEIRAFYCPFRAR